MGYIFPKFQKIYEKQNLMPFKNRSKSIIPNQELFRDMRV